MAKDSLIILTHSIAQGAKCAAVIPRKGDLQRFFLFLCAAPEPNQLGWLNTQDANLALPPFDDTDAMECAAVRAGLLYAIGWNLLYCYADSPPSHAELTLARQQIGGGAVVDTPNLWGASRDQLVFQGFDCLLPARLRDSQGVVSDVLRDMQVGQAIAGRAKPLPVILDALREVMPLSNVSLDPSALQKDEVHSETVAAIFALAASEDAQYPHTYILGSAVSPEYLLLRMSYIPKTGAVVLPTLNPSRYTDAAKPYQTLRCDNGLYILLFAGTRP